MKTLLAALALASLPALPAAAAAVIDIPFADAAFVQFGGVGDLLFQADAVVDGAPTQGSVVATFALSFDLEDDGGLLLGGLLSGIGFAEDQLFLTFAGLDGSAAALFGPELSLDLFFVGPVGADPLAGLSDGATYDVAGLGVGGDAPAPIPLPASGALLLAALGGVGLAAGRRARP